MFASWKKTYDQPGQNIKNQRHYFAGKGLFSQTIGFPLVMYGCQSWTINKAECSRIDAFELWCWRRLLRVPWTARRSNLSILKEINSICSLAGLMLKLKLHTLVTWFEELTHWKRLWCWEWLKAGEGGNRGWDGWMASLTWWTWIWATLGVGDEQGSLVCCSLWGHKKLDTTEQLKWTELDCSGIQQVSEGSNVYIATSDWPNNLGRYSVKWEFCHSFKTYYLLNI